MYEGVQLDCPIWENFNTTMEQHLTVYLCLPCLLPLLMYCILLHALNVCNETKTHFNANGSIIHPATARMASAITTNTKVNSLADEMFLTNISTHNRKHDSIKERWRVFYSTAGHTTCAECLHHHLDKWKRGRSPRNNTREVFRVFNCLSKDPAAQHAFFKHPTTPATKKAPELRGKSSSIPLMTRWDICAAATLFISLFLGSVTGATHVSNQMEGMVHF